MSSLTPQKPRDTRPPNKPSTPPPPKQPTQPTKPWGPSTEAAADILDDIAVMLEGAQGWATLLPDSTNPFEVCGQEILRHRLRMARRAVTDLLDYLTPGRRAPSPGGPVLPPAGTGKEPTPGSAAAVRSAARESAGAVVAASAGASSGRGGKDAFGGAAPRPGFTLPLRRAWPGRPFPVYVVPDGEVWQPSTPGQPPTPPPPDPHPQD